ncbi:methyl-accepting chemotaxis protein [Labilibacter marinus]|uniref:methyl-accepting chemotaxis protein n=1 Tax=Labilibacter marinus TaxID=1477105 RepID=UPI00094F76AD|nr:methyl-accepting chemotaxis protein [Labilibacter marinus]
MALKKRSILQRLFNRMMAFGIAMGLVFPVYANFFVDWKEGFFIYFVAGCILAGITVGVVSYWFVKVVLLKELLKVSDVAKSITHKNIDVKLDINSNDAVGDIANGFNEVIKTLKEFVSNTQDITLQVEEMGNEETINESSKGTISELNRTIDSVNDNTESISTISDSIRNEVLQIQDAVLKSNKKLQVLDEEVVNFSGMMDSLQKQTEKIEEIVKFVSEVATQTNLLALNASIEASKAGEFGKSFSVVATEVRMLSANISESVVEITDIVDVLNKDLNSANELNKSITSQFKSSLKENIRFTHILDKVDDYTDSNIKENHNLKFTVRELNNTVKSINSTFESFYSSVSLLNKSVLQYSGHEN